MSRPTQASGIRTRLSARRGRTGALLGALAAVLLIVSNTTFAQEPANKLQAIEIQTLPGQQLQLRLRLSGPAPEPLSFTIDKPARISLDLPNTGLALESRRIDVNSAGLSTILAAEANGRTRLVLNMDALVPYQTRVDGNTILVTLGGQAQIATAPVSGARAAAQGSASSGPRSIASLDFRRGPGGSGRVVVGLSDPRTPVNLRQEGTQIVVDFSGAQLPQNLMKRFDVTDFATPVSTVDAVRATDGTRLVISAGGDFEQLAYQSDNQYTVEVKPATKVRGGPDEKKEYTGERLTLNFQDIETRAVLQLLADTSGQNIVVSDSVQGNVTLRLQNVPWDQALDIVLKTKGLDMRRQDNVILVAPAEELAAREKAEFAAHKDLQELAPLRTEYLQVNYAKAEELANLISKGTGAQSLLSSRGSVSIDARTNTILVQDTSERLSDIRRLVSTLDIPVKQVLIEARIVIVNDDFSRDLGVRTGFTWKDPRQNGLLAVAGSAEAANTMLDSAITNLGNSGGASPNPVAVPTGQDNFTNRYNVNMPVANPAGRIALALLDSNYIVDLELSAAQAEGRGEIVSSPRVITANQKEASIEQGVEIPFQESSSSGATTTQFKKAVLSLKVTPLITPDNRVVLDLQINKDSVGQEVASATGGRVPSIDTRKITTQVLVNDGQTVVLGGILETEKREDQTKVPWLGDIPVLNTLFKSNRKVNNKHELLIFVTPKILKEGASLY
jgi:type IV pilus assembly protein PilQ